MKFDDLSLEKLRDLARSKKGHPGLKGFTTMKKDDLKKAIKKHFKVGGGSLEERANPLIKGDKYRLRTDVAGTGRKKDPFKAMNEQLKKRSAPKNKYPAPKGKISEDLEIFDDSPEGVAKRVAEKQSAQIPLFRNQKYRVLNPEKALLEEAEYNRAHDIATKTPIAALRTAYEHAEEQRRDQQRMAQKYADRQAYQKRMAQKYADRQAYLAQEKGEDSDSSTDYFIIPDDVHEEMVRNMKGGTLQDLPDEIVRKIEGYLPFEGSVRSNLRQAQFGDPTAPTEYLHAQSSGQPRLSEMLNRPGARTSDRMDVGSHFFDTA